MDDIIYRQAAIDALAEHEKSRGHNYTLFVDIVSECAEIIRNLPSAQPEIIRCKDCKYFNSYFVECDHESGLKHIKDGHDHCSYAERRTDDSISA